MILTQQVAEKKMQRMALEMAANNYDSDNIILIGIKENGIFIADVVAKYLHQNFKGTIEVISLSLNKKEPAGIELSQNKNFTGKHIVLIDDVANSGRTMLYALKPLLEFYPAKVETLALVERTHKHFPIAINYCGISVATRPNQNIIVAVNDGIVVGAHF